MKGRMQSGGNNRISILSTLEYMMLHYAVAKVANLPKSFEYTHDFSIPIGSINRCLPRSYGR